MRQLITFLSNCYGSWLHVYRRRHAKSIRASRFCNIFWGGSPPFGPFWLRPCWGSVWPVQFFLQRFPSSFSLIFLFASFFALLCVNFLYFPCWGGGVVSLSFRFPLPFFSGSRSRVQFGLVGHKSEPFLGRRRPGAAVFVALLAVFLRIFMENCLAIVAPQSNINEKHHDSPSCKASCPKPKLSQPPMTSTNLLWRFQCCRLAGLMFGCVLGQNVFLADGFFKFLSRVGANSLILPPWVFIFCCDSTTVHGDDHGDHHHCPRIPHHNKVCSNILAQTDGEHNALKTKTLSQDKNPRVKITPLSPAQSG